MKAYRDAYLRKFTEYLFSRKLKTIRLGALFLVWGWENSNRAAIVACRKGSNYIVRRKHRRIFQVMMDAILGDGLDFCRFDPDKGFAKFDLDKEPKWDGKKMRKKVAEIIRNEQREQVAADGQEEVR